MSFQAERGQKTYDNETRESQVLWEMLQDDHKCRGVSMERVWSESRTK